jgi:hypothetical protein
MRISTLILAAALAAAPMTSVLADPPAREVEAFMDEYLRLWNAHDAAAVTGRMYRFSDAANPMQTVTGLQANFDDLKKQGYDHSTKASIEGCLLSGSSALAEMRFTRWKTDGTPLGPKDRVSLYQLRKFPDGWRITQMIPMSLTAHLNCKSATE